SSLFRPRCATCLQEVQRGFFLRSRQRHGAVTFDAVRYPVSMPHEPPDYSKAHRHLSRRDTVLKRLIRELGPCTLRHDPNGFSVLCRSIVSQQISSKAARSIALRLIGSLPRKRLTPQAIAAASDQTLRAAGLSANKQRALRDLADKVLGGSLPLKKLPEMA